MDTTNANTHSNNNIKQSNVASAPQKTDTLNTEARNTEARNIEVRNNTGADIATGILLALIATVLFSIKPILVKFAYQFGGDPVAIMAIRAAFSLPFYLAMLLWLCRHQTHRNNLLRYSLPAGLVGVLGYYIASYLDILSLQYVSAQLERLLIFLFPTFVVLISWVWLKQTPSSRTLKATGLGYIGVSCIVAHDLSSMGSNTLLGSGLAIGSAIIFATYLVLSKSLITKMGSQLFTCIGMGSAGFIILLQSNITGVEPSTFSREFIIIGVIMGFFCTVLPSFLIAAAMQRLSPSQLSLTSNIGPAITAIFAVVLLGEAFTLYHAIGMSVVVYSVVLMNRK
nr:DMT family transporter [Photobacterium sanguinicancri]